MQLYSLGFLFFLLPLGGLAYYFLRGSGRRIFLLFYSLLFVALLLFVGIPIPGTGAWTGTLAASILDMDFKSTVAAAMCGVLLAGIIMMVVSLLGVNIFL